MPFFPAGLGRPRSGFSAPAASPRIPGLFQLSPRLIQSGGSPAPGFRAPTASAAPARSAGSCGPSPGVFPLPRTPSATPGTAPATGRAGWGAVRTSASRPRASPSLPASRSSSAKAVATKTQSKKLNSKPPSAADVQRNENLIPKYLEDSVRSSTKISYKSYWDRFIKFAKAGGNNIHSPKTVAAFLIYLAENTKGTAAPLTARNALKFYLKLDKPFKRCCTDSYYVSRIIQSIQTKFCKPVKKAALLSSEIVKALVLKLLESGSFKDERTATFVLIQFAAMARFEEMQNLKISNVTFLETGHMQLTFDKAKNYNVADVRSCCIAKNPYDLDPVLHLRKYLKKLNPDVSPFVFPNFRIGKRNKIEFQSKPVSYNNMLSLLRAALDSIGKEGKAYSLHSARRGALSECVNNNNMKVNRQDISRHVRWSGNNLEMVNHYNEISLANKLKPSQALKLYDKAYGDFFL